MHHANASKSCRAADVGARLWCNYNTLSILKWRHIAGRIVCSHVTHEDMGLIMSIAWACRLACPRAPNQQAAGELGALALFFEIGGDAMRNLIGWCPETRQSIDLHLYVDDATLSHIWSKAVRFQCPHCGIKHETMVERLASRLFSHEPAKNRPGHRRAPRLARRGQADGRHPAVLELSS